MTGVSTTGKWRSAGLTTINPKADKLQYGRFRHGTRPFPPALHWPVTGSPRPWRPKSQPQQLNRGCCRPLTGSPHATSLQAGVRKVWGLKMELRSRSRSRRTTSPSIPFPSFLFNRLYLLYIACDPVSPTMRERKPCRLSFASTRMTSQRAMHR